MARLEKLQARLPKSNFDPKAKATELGKDVEAAFRFVRDEIAFEAYAGVLRGATGTLVGRAGNSLDKSILLAELLKANGRVVRFARGQLDEAQAENLVNQMFARPAATNTEANPDTGLLQDLGMSEDEYKASVAEQEASSTAFFADLLKGLDEDYATIEGALAANNVGLDSVVDSRRQAIEETRDHFWVQYRDGDNWVDLDPSVASSKPGDSSSVSSVSTYDKLPDVLYHSVTFEVTMERMKGTEFQTTSLLKRSFKSADLFGTGVRFYNLPNLPSGDSSLSQMDKVSKFLPILVITDTQQYDQGFDLKGNPIMSEEFRPASLAGSAGDIGRWIEEAVDPTPSVMTAEWFDVRIKSPGQLDKVHRRTIIDRIGAENRTGGRSTTTSLKQDFRDEVRIRYLLMRSFTILVNSVFVSEEFVVNKLLSQLLEQKDVWAQMLKPASARRESDAMFTKTLQQARDNQQAIQLLAFDLDTQALIGQLHERHPDTMAYHHVPNVFGYVTALNRRGDNTLSGQDYFDIVDNALRIIGKTSDTRGRPETQLRIGVGQAYLERAAMRRQAEVMGTTPTATVTPGMFVHKRDTTVDVFANARKTGLIVSVLDQKNLQRLVELGLREEAKAGIRDDIEKGYIVIVPDLRVSSDDHEVGWWRVDPQDGTVIGIMESGLGQGTVTEIMLVEEELEIFEEFTSTLMAVDSFKDTLHECLGSQVHSSLKAAVCAGCMWAQSKLLTFKLFKVSVGGGEYARVLGKAVKWFDYLSKPCDNLDSIK